MPSTPPGSTQNGGLLSLRMLDNILLSCPGPLSGRSIALSPGQKLNGYVKEKGPLWTYPPLLVLQFTKPHILPQVGFILYKLSQLPFSYNLVFLSSMV